MKFKTNLLLSNSLILLYIILFSFLACMYPDKGVFTLAIWFVVEDKVALFVHIPFFILLLQTFLKCKLGWYQSYSFKILFINSIVLSVISYFIFWSIFILFFYQGEG